MKNFRSIILLLLVLVFFAKATTQANDCDFSRLVQEIPLLSEYTVEITEKAKKNKKYWDLLEKALPNVKRAFVSKDPFFTVLVGWGESLDNFSKFNREQVGDYLSQLAEVGKSNAQRQGGEFVYTISADDPLTMYVTLSYIDGGKPYKDIGFDIVAIPKCIASLKVSGRTDVLSRAYWQAFEEQFVLVRDNIKDKYGLVQFSESGSRIWWNLLINHLFWVFVIIVSAFSISRIYIRKVSLMPNPTTRKYSIFIMVIAVVSIVVTIWINDQYRPTDLYRYEYIPHFIFIFLVHLWAFLTNKPKVVAFALWLIVIALYSNVVFWVLGWSVLTKYRVFGIATGSALVIYTFVSAARTDKKEIQNKKL